MKTIKMPDGHRHPDTLTPTQQAIIQKLITWVEEHPGQWRMYMPKKPSQGARGLVYVATPPDDTFPVPPGTTAGPMVRLFDWTEEEAKAFGESLGKA